MTAIYNQTYYVPAWVVVQLKESDPRNAKVLSYLDTNGAQFQPWPSTSFKDTVQALSRKGWSHAIKPFPYIADTNFLTVAAAEHVRSLFGSSKSFNMAAGHKPWHQVVDRKIASEADYARVFDAIMSQQDSITLSHVFDIGSKCHTSNKRTFVFYTPGYPNINLLRSLSRNVIVVGDGAELNTAKLTAEQIIEKLDSQLETAIRP